jgi:hypothetical protein
MYEVQQGVTVYSELFRKSAVEQSEMFVLKGLLHVRDVMSQVADRPILMFSGCKSEFR